jgi:sulfite exporter TauE/SafE
VCAVNDHLLAILDSGLHHCQIALQSDSGLIGSLALAGLAGGLSHCAGMCGPFVLSQVAARLEDTPASRMREWHRLTGAALLPYHLGRAVTYTGLGGLGAALAGEISSTTGLHWLSAVLLLAAALFMAGLAIPSLKRLLAGTGAETSGWNRTLERLARPLFGQPTGWRGFALGLLLGFLPCGLLYGALAAAAASGTIFTGMAGMLAFAAGTWPSLFVVGLLGHLAGQRWRTPVLRYAPFLLLVNAGMLTWLAWRHLA